MAKAAELEELAAPLDHVASQFDRAEVRSPVEALAEAADRVGQAASGSWLGYHAVVYYRGFAQPPPGARFSQDWGLMPTAFVRETVGDWVEYDRATVESAVLDLAGRPDLREAERALETAQRAIIDAREVALSLLSGRAGSGGDPYLDRLIAQLEKTDAPGVDRILSVWKPSHVVTRDRGAGSQFVAPPHLVLAAKAAAVLAAKDACAEMSGVLHRAAAHLQRETAGPQPLGGDTRMEGLHPKVRMVAEHLFADGHRAAAVLEAFKAVNNRVKDLVGPQRGDRDGKGLMSFAFGGDQPPLRINRGTSDSDADEQAGFCLLYMGAMLGVRNPKAHDELTALDSDRALDYLSFASLLLRRLDDAEHLAQP